MECYNIICRYHDKDEGCTAFDDGIGECVCVHFAQSKEAIVHRVIEEFKKSCDQILKLVSEMKGDDHEML